MYLPPPSYDDRQDTNLENSEKNNPAPGMFRHRADHAWKNCPPADRTRIAHAWLIQGSYGVIPPESCPAFRTRGTRCLVYHPGLTDGTQSVGTYCGEFQNLIVKWETGPNQFKKHFIRTTDI